MKLADLDRLMKGTRAIKRVALPLVNTPGPLLADQPELARQRAENAADAEADAPIPEVGLRVLTGAETALIYEKTWEDARARGCEKPDESDPTYALLLSAWTLALACVDPDSDPCRPALFFGETPTEAAKNILASPHIGRDGIAYLAEQHETWQDLCHPQAARIDPDQFWAVIAEAATSEDAGPFLRMRPALRWSCLRSMAGLLVSSQLDKSQSGTDSASSTTNDTPPKTDP